MKRIIIPLLLLFLVGCNQPKEMPVPTQEPAVVQTEVKVQSEEERERARAEAIERTKENQSIQIVVPSKGTEEEKPTKEERKSLNKSYNWYYDQGESGQFSGENCGPCTAVMATKWYLGEVKETPEEARQLIRPDGGWWFTNDITDFLRGRDVPTHVKEYKEPNDLTEVIDNGNIAIICIDTTYLTFNSKSNKFGRFYDFQGGHFIIVKGYRVIEDELYFETYDPMSWGKKRSDGTYVGENRYYKARELSNAILRWWPNLIAVGN
ncbi:cysteine peptidase family C39 domain-containing protein [Guggenheimella bovis]